MTDDRARTATSRHAGSLVLRHVLCVDDDADIRAILELALGTVGNLEVSTCESGADALETLQRSMPDMVLLDVVMPEMDGLETLAHIVETPRTASLPVVMLTANTQEHEVASYRSAGAVGVIAKPFDPLDLADRLRQIHRSLG